MPSTAQAIGSNGARSRHAVGRPSDQSAWVRGLGYRAMRVLMDVVDGAEIMPVSGPYRAATGRVGTMDTQDVYAAVLTGAERSELLDPGFNDAHALYRATHDALLGMVGEPAGLRPTFRTTALVYAILRGPRRLDLQGERDWLAVAMFGSIGLPRPAWEHEAVGLGICNL